MKKILLSLTLVVFCMNGFAQTPEEMKAWQNSMTPNENHKWLATMDGEWNGEMKLWTDPSQPPTTSNLTTNNEMIMNGLYQRSIHKGDMMGMPFKGEGLAGFDNAKKKFVSTWIDNMGSGISMMEGSLNGNTLTLYGVMTDPMSGKELKMKQVLNYVSEDEHTFEMFMEVDGTEMKSMEIVYTRKK